MMVQAPSRRQSRVELSLYATVCAYTIFELAKTAYYVSREFDRGHSQSGARSTLA